MIEKKPQILIAAEPVSAYEAKTHLPKLLERVAAGENFVITRHGKPVARLGPYESASNEIVRALLDSVSSSRANLGRSGITLREVLDDGERVRDMTHAGHRY